MMVVKKSPGFFKKELPGYLWIKEKKLHEVLFNVSYNTPVKYL